MITQKELKKIVDYNHSTGVFVWKINLSTKQREGSELKRVLHGACNRKYLHTKIGENNYLLHRLAWLYIYGNFPSGQIDHIDSNGLNNRIDNLRDVSNQENAKNQTISLRNTSGFTGVSYAKDRNKWKVSISVNGKDKYLGCFDKIEDAIATRKKANVKYGYHKNHGSKKHQSLLTNE